MRFRFFIGIFASAALVIGIGANGQEPAGQTISLEEALAVCSTIRDEGDRLDCFENLAEAVKTSPQRPAQAEPGETFDAERQAPEKTAPPSNPDIAEADPAERENERRFVIVPADEAEALARAPRRDEKRTRRRGVVRRSWVGADRQMRIVLADGTLLKESPIAHPNRLKKPSSGDVILLKPAFFGGYYVELRNGYPSLRMSVIN